MATTNTKPETTIDSIYERANEAGEQVTEAARKIGNAYLDTYEKAVDRALELELKVAGSTQQEWLKGLIETQAEFARELTSSYTSTARTFLK
jgi:hypothetical protein